MCDAGGRAGIVLRSLGVPVLASSALLILAVGCRDSTIDRPPGSGGGADAGVPVDGGGGGGGADAGGQGRPDVDTPPIGCNNPPVNRPADGVCTVTRGSNDAVLVQADLVVPDGLLENGHLLVGTDGRIACAACDCSSHPLYAAATRVECAAAVVSPGLINAHEHITFTEAPPLDHGEERFDHRHDWRRGQNGHTRLPAIGNEGGNRGVLWGELRHLMGGATSLNGSGGAGGLMRNLDRAEPLQEGLGQAPVEYQTFPLGDSSGTTRTNGCNYGTIDNPNSGDIRNAPAYTPHVAEGINVEARNEFLCTSDEASGGQDLLFEKTGLIHGIGLFARDYAAMSAERASLIWSPRSNIDLYGHTAQVTVARNVGVNIAIGTDWVLSGSMNLLRELACADQLNRDHFGGALSDRELVDIATINGAIALGAQEKIGSLAVGRFADLAIFDSTSHPGYRAILDGHPRTVVLVMRGGTPLYGDRSVMNGLLPDTNGCETVDVCTRGKLLCVEADTGNTLAQLRSAVRAMPYEPFYCDPVPPREPSCVPFRAGEFSGMPTATDQDGDGVPDSADNCPRVFNPPRPLDDLMQADADGDLLGDACDPCPLDAMSNTCGRPDPNDRDGDMVPNAMDNCPSNANTDQSDRDMDMIGDVCDACPDTANPGGSACPATIYAIKQGMAMGAVSVPDAVVTAVAPNGYFVQVPTDAQDATLAARFSGLFVFTGPGDKPARGDRVTLEGEVSVFFGQTQLSNASFTVESSGEALPAFVVATPAEVGTGGANASAYEGVLVEVRNVTVTELDPMPGPGDRAPNNEMVVDGALRVNDLMYLPDPRPTVGQQLGFVRGVLRLANEDSKLEPRDATDLGTPATLLDFDPAELTVAFGTMGVPAGGFRLRLTRTTTAALTVRLSSTSPIVTPPATLSIPAGQDGVDVPLTVGSTAAVVMGSIRAELGARQVEATFTAFGDQSPRSPTSVEVLPGVLRPGTVGAVRVRLDLPAGSTGATVRLSLDRMGPSVPMNLVFAPGTRTASAGVSAGTSTGAFQLTATLDGRSVRTGFLVSNSVTRAPMPGDLRITEVMRNPGGAQPEKDREWFELFNASTDDLLLEGVVVADNGGSYTIPAGVMLAAGSYGTIAYSSDPAVNGGITTIAAYGSADLQLSNNGDRIRLSRMGMQLVQVEWGGMWPGAANGVAMCLKQPYMDGSMPAHWGDSVGMLSTGDSGHPNVASDATNCP